MKSLTITLNAVAIDYRLKYNRNVNRKSKYSRPEPVIITHN